MNLRDFKYICAVAEHHHFGRAAEVCHVSQPTLSSQIKKLEDYLGVQIFERTKRRVFLTPVGQGIIKIAHKILMNEKEIRSLANFHKDPLSGELLIGIIPTIAPALIPRLLPRLMKEYPGIEPVFIEAKTEHVLRQLNEGKVDFAIVATEAEHRNHKEIPLYEEPFRAVFPKTHALASKKRIYLSDLNKEEVLLLCQGHCLRDQILDLYQLPRTWIAHSRAATRATSIETLVNLVASGYGITLLPDLSTRGSWAKDDRIEIRPLAMKEAKRNVRIVHRTATHRLIAIQKISETIQANFSEF